MARRIGWTLALLLGLIPMLATSAAGNVAEPERERPDPAAEPLVSAAVVVEHEKLAGDRVKVKLVLPRSVVKSLSAAEDRQSSLPRSGTVIAGIALSLAAVSSVLLVRQGRSRRVGQLLLVVGLVMGFGAVTLADIPIPNDNRRPPVKDRVLIEVSDDEESVKVILAK